MESIDALKLDLRKLRNRLRGAEDDVDVARQQLARQEKRLDSLLEYQAECQQGFLSLPANAFYHAQRREARLLLNHLDQELAEQQQRVEDYHRHLEKLEKAVLPVKQQYEQCRQRIARLEAEQQAEHQRHKMEPLPRGDESKAGRHDDDYDWIQLNKKV